MHRNKNAASKEDSVTWHAVKEVNSPARAKRSRNNTFFEKKKCYMTHTCAVSLAPAKTCRRVAALVQRLTDDEIVCSACVYTRYCRWWGREMEEPSIVFVVFFIFKKTHIHILVLCWCTTTLQSIRTLAAWRCIFSRKSKSHAHAQNTHASMPPDAHF